MQTSSNNDALYSSTMRHTFLWEYIIVVVVATLVADLAMEIADVRRTGTVVAVTAIILYLATSLYLRFSFYLFRIYDDRIDVTYPFHPEGDYSISIGQITSLTWQLSWGIAPFLVVTWNTTEAKDKILRLPISADLHSFAGILKTFRQKGIQIQFKPESPDYLAYVDGKRKSLPTEDLS
jgi:hypothetical protein